TFVETLPEDDTVECDNIPDAITLTATDNCDNELEIVQFSQTRNNTVCASEYELVRTWTITDCAGNSASHTQTITVVDTTPP
ncbi:hypothetical protein, partial [Jejuia spongiicola]